jgi:hypothetical protein
MLTTKEYDMSRTLNVMNWTCLGMRKATDKLVGTGDGTIRGYIPTAATACAAGFKGHRVVTRKGDKAPSTWDERVEQYMKDHPDPDADK